MTGVNGPFLGCLIRTAVGDGLAATSGSAVTREAADDTEEIVALVIEETVVLDMEETSEAVADAVFDMAVDVDVELSILESL